MPDVSAVDPSQDPANLAFQRAQGYSEDAARASTQAKIDALNRQLNNGLPDYQAQETAGLKQIAGTAEDNGVWASGQRLTDQQTLSNNVARARNQFETGIQNQIIAANQDLVSQIAALRQQAAEQNLNAYGNIILSNATQGIYG